MNYGNRESMDYSGSSSEDNQQERRVTDEMTDSGNDEGIVVEREGIVMQIAILIVTISL